MRAAIFDIYIYYDGGRDWQNFVIIPHQSVVELVSWN